MSFLLKKNALIVKSLLEGLSKKYHVRIYHYAINGNHLHLLIKGKDKLGIQNFFRVLSGQLAEKVTRACRGNAFSGKFGDHLIFSRIVEWGRDFFGVKKYVEQNVLEAAGVIAYTTRK